MGKYTILSNGKRINMFDRDMGVDLSLKSYVYKYSLSTIINKVGIFITGDNSKVISVLQHYFEENKLLGFIGPIVFIKIIESHNQLKRVNNLMYRIDTKDNIVKADLNDDYLFIADGVNMKINKGFHYAEIAFTYMYQFMDFVPYLIKVVEGMVIENHLRLGYFPLHAALVKSNEDDGILVMGDSQTGKSTIAGLLCEDTRYEIISDDITFIDLNGKVTPFGQYRKVTSNKADKDFCEQIKTDNITVYRKISKISVKYKDYKIKCIIFPQIVCNNEPECIRLETVERIKIITQLLADYPDKWFLFSDFNEVLRYQMVRELANNVCFTLKMKYKLKSTRIVKLWEETCNI